MRLQILAGVGLALVALPPVAFAADAADGASEATFLTHTRQLTFEGKRSGEGYFSADGKQLIFQAEREADDPFYQIYILSFETGDVHRVSPGTGISSIQMHTALRLGKYFGVSPELWLSLQVDYDLRVAKRTTWLKAEPRVRVHAE